MDVFDRTRACGVLPVVALPDRELAVPLARTLADAGIPAVEITFRTDGAAEAIAAIRASVPDVLVAAGTVTTVEQARAATEAGAALVVAPGTNPAVIEAVAATGTPMLPGVATPSEIEANLGRGIRFMKLFPAELLGGVGFLRAVHGPYRDARFVPTGGVSEENLAGYLAAPNVLAVGGTWIAPAEALARGDWASIGEAAGRAAAIVARIRRGDGRG